VSDENQGGARDAVEEFSRDIKKKRFGGFRLPGLGLGGVGGLLLGLLKILVPLAIVGPLVATLIYRVVDPPGTILMVQRWIGGAHIVHQNVVYDDVSPNIVRAVLAAEDARFCRHKGFDMEAIQKAYAANQKKSNVAKGKVRGGSTVSQQTAKNVFLWPARSFVRKGAEAYFTFIMEHTWPKSRIMQSYLNVAEWGDGVFGVQAASQKYFGVSAGQLSPRQAALLAAVLPSPNKWSPSKPGPYVRKRAATIEARMYAIYAQGLDDCVKNARWSAPPKPRGKIPTTLTPLPDLPPDVALNADAPVLVMPENLNAPVAPMDGAADDAQDQPEIEAAPPAATESAAPPT
jgi:monofunctional glycosyltransferase